VDVYTHTQGQPTLKAGGVSKAVRNSEPSWFMGFIFLRGSFHSVYGALEESLLLLLSQRVMALGKINYLFISPNFCKHIILLPVTGNEWYG
jgi:hypothetical protein